MTLETNTVPFVDFEIFEHFPDNHSLLYQSVIFVSECTETQ